MTRARWFVVDLEAETGPIDDELAEILGDALAASKTLRSAALSAGGGIRGVGATASVRAQDIPRACERAYGAFGEVLSAAGVAHEIGRVTVLTERASDAELETEPDQLAGVSEVAALLGVSRQRVAELRARDGFPEPIATLAAGPVWSVSMLRRFMQEWVRKPGRPGRVATG